MSRPPVNRDLFGAPPAGDRDATSTTLLMREVGKGTDKAWHLAPVSKPAAIGFAPRALVSRGVGPTEQQFTMPRWLARERGWL